MIVVLWMGVNAWGDRGMFFSFREIGQGGVTAVETAVAHSGGRMV